MSTTICTCCGSPYHWSWEEAFDKFGFSDGDGVVMTETVAEALRHAGYTVTVHPWGCHNVVITAITRADASFIAPGSNLGYDDPRDYLMPEIIELLDRGFPEVGKVKP